MQIVTNLCHGSRHSLTQFFGFAVACADGRQTWWAGPSCVGQLHANLCFSKDALRSVLDSPTFRIAADANFGHDAKF